MKIDEVKTSLPNEEEFVSSFFESCEKRKKFVPDTKDHYKEHLKKAKHDLSRAIAEYEDECFDWTVIKAYYAIHHAGNALLSKHKGVFSKDNTCLIISLKHYNLIDKSLFDELSKINEAFSDVLSLDLAFQLRKISQYSVDEWEHVTRYDAKLILEISKRFIKFVEEGLC